MQEVIILVISNRASPASEFSTYTMKRPDYIRAHYVDTIRILILAIAYDTKACRKIKYIL